MAISTIAPTRPWRIQLQSHVRDHKATAVGLGLAAGAMLVLDTTLG